MNKHQNKGKKKAERHTLKHFIDVFFTYILSLLKLYTPDFNKTKHIKFLYIAVLLSYGIDSSHARVYTRKANSLKLPLTNFVADVGETKNKYLWFATDEGLSAFDGNKYIQYGNIYSKDLVYDNINSLWVTSDDIIWLGAQYGLLSFNYHTQKFTSYEYRKNGAIKPLAIKTIKIIDDNFIVIKTINKGLYLFNIEQKRYIPHAFDSINKLSKPIVGLAAIKGGVLLLSQEVGLIKLNINKAKNGEPIVAKKIIPLPPNTIKGLQFVTELNTNIWLATHKEFIVIDNNTLSVKNTIDLPKSKIDGTVDYTVTDMLEVQSQELMISTKNNGILFYHNGKFTQDINYYLDKATLSNNRIYKLFKDSHETIWILSKGNTVDTYQHHKQAITAISPILKLSLSTLKPYSVNAIYREKNKLWLGTDEGIITNNNYHDKVGYIEFDKPNQEHSNISVLKKINNEYFIILYDRILTLDKTGKIKEIITLKHPDGKKETGVIQNIIEDSDHDIWILTHLGLYKHTYNPQKPNSAYNFKRVKLNVQNSMLDIFNTKRSTLIIATYSEILEYDKDKQTIVSLIDKKDQFQTIQNVEYKYNTLYLATNKGLFTYSEKTKQLYQYKGYQNKLYKTNIYNMFPINKSEVFLGLSNGLALYNIETNKHKYIDVSNLLEKIDFNYKSSFLYESKLYLGTVSGLIIIDLEKIKINYSTTIPNILINGLKIANKKIINLDFEDLSVIKLKQDENSFTLLFSAMNNPNNKELLYRYKMTNIQDYWTVIPVLDDKLVKFANLKSGKYQFQIQASINYKDWGKVSSMDIIIDTSLWRTKWAYAAYLGAFISFFILIFKNRIRLIHAKFEEVRQLQVSRKIFNSSSDAMCIVSKDLNIKKINQSFSRITGFHTKNITGKAFFDLLNKKSLEKIQKIINPQVDFSTELELITNKKELITINFTINPMGDEEYNIDKEFFITFKNITEQKKYRQQLEYLSFHDSLTGLPNRIQFIKHLDNFKKLADATKQRFAVVYIDLNDFKKVNDHFGHRYGDMLLKILGKRFLSTMKNSIQISRFGGDEFCLLLPEIDFNIFKSLKKLNHKLQDIFTKPFIIEDHQIIISPSIGVSIYPTHSKDTEELMKFADIAMYTSKKQKIASYTIYDENLQLQIYPRVKLEVDLKNAIEQKLIVPYIQPQILIETGEVIGYEILSRWITQDRQLISPVVFIPIAEKSGIINDIFLQILKVTVNKFNNEFKNNKTCNIKLSFNLCPNQLYNRSLIKQMNKIISESNIPTTAIVLEITETALISHPDHAKQSMLNLKKQGYRIALDDFGTGHSSLTHLKDFPVDFIKIDKSFISSMLTKPNVFSIVESVIILAKKLNITIIAEGVEKLIEVQTLKSLQCEIIQGYYYGKPQAIDYYLKTKTNPSQRLLIDK